MDNRKSKLGNKNDIKTFDDLRKVQVETEIELEKLRSRVKLKTNRLVSDSIQVVGAGLAAAFISKVLSSLVSKSTEDSSERVNKSGASKATSKTSEEPTNSAYTGRTGRTEDEGTTLSKAGHWLELISEGLHTAKILLDHVDNIIDTSETATENGTEDENVKPMTKVESVVPDKPE